MRRPLKLIRLMVFLSLFLILVFLSFLVFGKIDQAVEAAGTVQPTRLVTVKAEVGGLVKDVAVVEGKRVAIGDTLMSLNDEELVLQADRARRTLAEAQARLATLEEEYRLEDDYLRQLDEARWAAVVARDAHEYAMRQVENALTVAPIAGSILTRRPEDLVGTRIAEGDVVLEIGDLSSLDFVANLPELEISQVEVGQEAKIFIKAFPHLKYKTFRGHVKKVASRPTQSQRGMSFETTIEIEEPWVVEGSDTLRLRPGLSGTARIITRPGVRLLESVLGSVKRK